MPPHSWQIQIKSRTNFSQMDKSKRVKTISLYANAFRISFSSLLHLFSSLFLICFFLLLCSVQCRSHWHAIYFCFQQQNASEQILIVSAAYTRSGCCEENEEPVELFYRARWMQIHIFFALCYIFLCHFIVHKFSCELSWDENGENSINMWAKRGNPSPATTTCSFEYILLVINVWAVARFHLGIIVEIKIVPWVNLGASVWLVRFTFNCKS